MENKSIRLLRADEIECRTGIIRENGLSLLLYKDARVDQNILDEVFGIFGWKREHQIMDGKMFCTISVKDAEGNWIGKQDVGTESNAEAVKGAASDSFKRAAFNIGIGRELYSAPFIWLRNEVVRIEKRGDRYITRDSFHVSDIQYNEKYRTISALRICNQDMLVVYETGMGYTPRQTGNGIGAGQGNVSGVGTGTTRDEDARPAGRKGGRRKKRQVTDRQVYELRKELKRTGVDEFLVLQRYGVTSVETMDEETYLRAMSGLQKTPDAA